MLELKQGERVNHLFQSNLRVIQSDDILPFSLDSALLAKFVYLPIKSGQVIDLCTGNGSVALLLTDRTRAKITAVDIQKKLCEMAKRSVSLNHLEEQINVLCKDVKQLTNYFGKHQFDVVTCNPPYFSKQERYAENISDSVAIARHELLLTLEEAVYHSALLVKQKGKVAFVHRPERFLELCDLMRKYNLEPKRVQWVYPKQGKTANIMLIEAIRDGKPGLKILPPLFVYNEEGNYTKELNGYCYEG